MRVIALLSWFDESPAWLAACVASASRIADHVVAVDGAYALYPRGRASSGTQQSDAVRLAAEATGIGCTIHVPRTVWAGNEVEKRDAMFTLGQVAVDAGRDWFLVLDADEVVTECDRASVCDQLASTDLNVASIAWETYNDHSSRGDHLTGVDHRTSHMARRLFRSAATPIRVAGQHWRYVRDGEVLWGRGAAPAVDLDGIRVEHRSHLRPPVRRESAKAYYATRDALRVESAPVEVAA